MSTKRFPLFFTEILLLILLTNLYWPIQTMSRLPAAFHGGVHLGLQLVAVLVVGILPGWWWSYLFFTDTELSFWERIGMSIALSCLLVVFSRIYLGVFGISVSYGLGLAVISGWILLGMLCSLLVADRKRVTSEHVSE